MAFHIKRKGASIDSNGAIFDYYWRAPAQSENCPLGKVLQDEHTINSGAEWYLNKIKRRGRNPVIRLKLKIYCWIYTAEKRHSFTDRRRLHTSWLSGNGCINHVKSCIVNELYVLVPQNRYRPHTHTHTQQETLGIDTSSTSHITSSSYTGERQGRGREGRKKREIDGVILLIGNSFYTYMENNKNVRECREPSFPLFLLFLSSFSLSLLFLSFSLLSVSPLRYNNPLSRATLSFPKVQS